MHRCVYIVWGHDMKLTRLIALAIVAGSIGVTAVQAQNTDRQPAEFPPSSYNGKQYVDSRGCVFIRAGIDGNVTWVPRVSRARKVVCGFQPTGISQVAAAPKAPKEAPVQITMNAPVKSVPAPAPVKRVVKPAAKPVVKQAPAPRVVEAPRPKPLPAPVVVRQTAPVALPKPAPRPRVVAAAPVATTRTVTSQTVRAASACPGASALSQQYLRSSGKNVIRCGPQDAPIVGNRRATQAQVATLAPVARTAPVATVAPAPRRAVVAQAPAPVTVTANTRIVPKHVAHNRINTRNVEVPKGYRKVWDDGRLNPYRAEQTLAGRHEMLLVWTQTVPRRLIDTRTGKDVTASVPLIYPYIDVITQSRELGTVEIVQRDGQRLKRVLRKPGAAPIQRQQVTRKPVYSSRSAPRAVEPQATAPARAVAGKQYVQVGTFGNPANAQRAAQKIASLGFPARIGKHIKGGKSYLTVQAGPFKADGSTQNAMARLKRAGYRDAFARN